MGKLLRRAGSPEMINRAWRHYRNDQAVWSEHVVRDEMEKDIAYHLLCLSDEIRSGTYRPDPVRVFPVVKHNGGTRILSALTLRDKVAQRAVLETIEPTIEALFHHNSYGYRKGRSRHMALARAAEYQRCGGQWVVDADIENFFDTILHRPLLLVFDKLLKDKELTKLMGRWLRTGVNFPRSAEKRAGLPQGAVLSPLLCNLYLTRFDNYLNKKGVPFVRFADDFLMFATHKKEALKTLDAARKGLQRLNLRINMAKTRVVKAGPEVVFLGLQLPRHHREQV